MIINENDILNFPYHIEIKVLEKFGVKILGTKKNYGCIKQKNSAEILKDFNIENKILISTHQTHSDNIEVVNQSSKTYFENTDGLLTSNPEFALLVKYADCLPIFIYDEASQSFGAIHSGWKGSYQEIVIKAINKISKNVDLNKIHIVFGWGISCSNYEVKSDFYLNFKEKFSKDIVDSAFKKENNKYFFDNQLFNYLLIKKLGIPDKNIYTNDFCTFSSNSFHSYRRDKDLSGRNGAIIYRI